MAAYANAMDVATRRETVMALCPRQGEVMRDVLNEETRDVLAKKLAAMPSSDTWYKDIYNKAIYGPMLFQEPELKEVTATVERHFPGYRILADLYLEKKPSDQGFPFHTDFDSNGFMERPEQMISVWFPLTPVNAERGGQLSVVTEDGAVRLSLIRVAIQLHSLQREVDRSIPPHRPFELSYHERHYLEKTRFTPDLDPGDALVFCNAFFHKSEPVHQGTRCAYILRLVPKECAFNLTRLLALRSLGQNLNVVNTLLKEHYPEALAMAEKADAEAAGSRM